MKPAANIYVTKNYRQFCHCKRSNTETETPDNTKPVVMNFPGLRNPVKNFLMSLLGNSLENILGKSV